MVKALVPYGIRGFNSRQVLEEIREVDTFDIAACGRPDGRRCHRRRVQGDHRTAAGRRPAVLRRPRQGRGPVRGGGPAAGPEADGQRHHADCRRDRPDAAGLLPAGDARHQSRGGPAGGVGRNSSNSAGGLLPRDGGILRHPGRSGLRERQRPDAAGPADPQHPGRAQHRNVYVPVPAQAGIQLGNTMTQLSTAPSTTRTSSTPRGTDRQQAARDHLWMHMARHSGLAAGGTVPVITRGEGHLIYDDQGREYIDGLAGLFVVQVGHGREELAEAAALQARELAFMPLWSYAHEPAIDLAERLAHYAPGDLNRVFFTTGGGEAVESAWKLAKQYFKLRGKPGKTKVVSRAVAYHGTPQGALAITS